MDTCPKCGGPLASFELGWFAGQPEPEKVAKCEPCNAIWLSFTAAHGLPVVLNAKDRPVDRPVSEWVREQIAARAAN